MPGELAVTGTGSGTPAGRAWDGVGRHDGVRGVRVRRGRGAGDGTNARYRAYRDAEHRRPAYPATGIDKSPARLPDDHRKLPMPSPLTPKPAASHASHRP